MLNGCHCIGFARTTHVPVDWPSTIQVCPHADGAHNGGSADMHVTCAKSCVRVLNETKLRVCHHRNMPAHDTHTTWPTAFGNVLPSLLLNGFGVGHRRREKLRLEDELGPPCTGTVEVVEPAAPATRFVLCAPMQS